MFAGHDEGRHRVDAHVAAVGVARRNVGAVCIRGQKAGYHGGVHLDAVGDIGEHIRIGIETLERLAQDAGSKLHSRKLRAFDEPPFR